MPDATTKALNIKLVILDVDGVLSDGKQYFTNLGEEIKSFSVKDGVGIKMLHQAGIRTAIITGRNSNIVSKRANELNISILLQGRDDKQIACREVSKDLNIPLEEIAYIGDDLPDLSAIKAVGLGITVPNACALVKEHADIETKAAGGEGAVREACEFILEAQGKLNNILQAFH